MKSLNLRITPARLFVATLLLGAVAWAGNTSIDYGNRYIKGNLTVDGTVTAYFPYDGGTITSSVIDAGVLNVQGQETVAGPLTVAGNLILTATTTKTTCTLVDGTNLSSCTATVRSGSTCTCTPVGTTAAIAAGGCAVSLSGTTLTATGPDNGNWVVNIHCF